MADAVALPQSQGVGLAPVAAAFEAHAAADQFKAIAMPGAWNRMGCGCSYQAASTPMLPGQADPLPGAFGNPAAVRTG